MKPWHWCVVALVLWLALQSFVEAKGFTLSVGVGNNTNLNGASIPWDDGGGMGAYFQLKYTHPISESLSVVTHWTHLSQWDIGPPFNHRDEASVDHIGAAIEYNF